MWRRSDIAPAFWRVVDDSGPDHQGRALPVPDARRSDLWRLTLEARGIPYLASGHGDRQRLFVSPMHERLARQELAALKAETGRPPLILPPARHNAHWTLFCLLFLLFWHGLRMGWWPLPFEHLPDPGYWLAQGQLDVLRILRFGEWRRTFTALTLHADSLHLFSNILFSAPFLILLARRLGLGLTLFLVLTAGAAGNALNVFYRSGPYYSVGFSTAMFSAVGLLCADMMIRDRGHGLIRRALLPLAAGLGLLAMLGTEGERTDYAAHIFGLLAGFVWGLSAGALLSRFGPLPRVLENAAGLLAVTLLSGAWIAALSS